MRLLPARDAECGVEGGASATVATGLGVALWRVEVCPSDSRTKKIASVSQREEVARASADWVIAGTARSRRSEMGMLVCT
jgi:hypothetical protein